MPRIALLKEKEIIEFDSPGVLTEEQRNAVSTDDAIIEMVKLSR